MSSEEGKFAGDCLTAINKYRSHHQVEPLSYNQELERISRRWVDHMTQRNVFGHNPDRSYKGGKLGENIASQWSSNPSGITGAQIAEQWYSEIKDYDFNASRGRGSAVVGHFTQLVWKDSKEMGIARAQTKDGTWMIVANFFPPGNFNNDEANNVFPPRDGKITSPTNKDHKPQHAEQSGRQSASPYKALSSQHPAKAVGTSKQEQRSTKNGVTTTNITETTTFEDGVKEVKVTQKVEGPGSAPKETLHPSTSNKTPTDKYFCHDVVNNHNTFRHRHRDTEDLILSDQLTALAQSWADHLAQTKSLQHSKMTYEGRPVGESIASKHGTGHVDYTAEEVVSQWYKEIEKYEYRNPPDSHSGTGTGHFTQVVWRDSKEIGVGKAFSTDNRVYVVALYYPAGNYVGRENYETNVKPLKHD